MRAALVLALLLVLTPLATAASVSGPRIGPGCGEFDLRDPNSVACWLIFLPLTLACTATSAVGGPQCPA